MIQQGFKNNVLVILFLLIRVRLWLGEKWSWIIVGLFWVECIPRTSVEDICLSVLSAIMQNIHKLSYWTQAVNSTSNLNELFVISNLMSCLMVLSCFPKHSLLFSNSELTTVPSLYRLNCFLKWLLYTDWYYECSDILQRSVSALYQTLLFRHMSN